MKLKEIVAITMAIISPFVFADQQKPKEKTINPLQLVAMYGESDAYAVRWMDGIVSVYDATQYPYMDQILETLNRDLSDVKLVRVNSPEKALIQIKYGKTQKACGLTTTWTNRMTRTFTGAEVVMSEDMRSGFGGGPGLNISEGGSNEPRCMGSSKGFAAYLHEVTHAVGFSRHTQDGDSLMDKTLNTNADVRVPNEYRVFLQALYALPAGAEIPSNYEEMKPDTYENIALYQLLPRDIQSQPELAKLLDRESFKNRPGNKIDVASSDLKATNIQDNKVAMIDASKENNFLPMPPQDPPKKYQKEPKIQSTRLPIINIKPDNATEQEAGFVLVKNSKKQNMTKQKMPVMEFKPGVQMASVEKSDKESGFYWEAGSNRNLRGKPLF